MVPRIMAKIDFLFAREASLYLWSGFPARQGIPKIHHFGTQNLFEIRPRTQRPMVPKVEPPGAPAKPKIRRKVEKIVSASPFESDAGKNLVSDRLKHRKRSSRASGGTVSARAENHRKVSKTMPEGVQKRPGSVKKPSRNVSEISRKNHASKNRKMSPKELPAAPPRHLKIV